MPKEVSLPIAMKGVGPQVFLFKISLQNAPGALVKIAKLLAQYEVNILSSLIDASLGEAEATIISFMDFSRTSVPVEELVQELKRLDVVYDVQVVKPQIPGLIINTFMQSPTILGVRCVFLPVVGLGRILQYLYSKFGEPARALMYYGGYGSIKEMVRGVRRLARLGKANLLNVCLQLFQVCGYGRFEISHFSIEPLHVVVKAYDLYECVGFKGRLGRPNSQMFRGILAGIVEEITGKRVTIVEEKCLAKGDPYCQFVIKGI